MRRRLAVRRPAFMRMDAIAQLANAKEMRLTSTIYSEGFCPRYRVSISETDPFDTEPGFIYGGESYPMVMRWAEIKFRYKPERSIYIWDTQSLANPNGLHLIRKFTYLLSNSDLGFYSRNEIDE